MCSGTVVELMHVPYAHTFTFCDELNQAAHAKPPCECCTDASKLMNSGRRKCS